MEVELKSRLTSRDLWIRALYMLFFVIAYSVAELVITLIVLFQFVSVLFTGSANTSLLKFGHNLSTYVYQVFRFLTFNTEMHPFPFSDWPDETPEGSRWVDQAAEPLEAAEETQSPGPVSANPPDQDIQRSDDEQSGTEEPGASPVEDTLEDEPEREPDDEPPRR